MWPRLLIPHSFLFLRLTWPGLAQKAEGLVDLGKKTFDLLALVRTGTLLQSVQQVPLSRQKFGKHRHGIARS
jgi:hypothetical protein